MIIIISLYEEGPLINFEKPQINFLNFSSHIIEIICICTTDHAYKKKYLMYVLPFIKWFEFLTAWN